MNIFVVLTLALTGLSLARPLTGTVECLSCHATIDALQKHYQDPSLWTKYMDILEGMCEDVGHQTPGVCQGAVSEFEGPIVYALTNKYLDPDHLCLDLGFCTSPTYVEENFTNYVITTMQGKPPGPGPVPTNRKSFNFVHISDIHLDIYYTEGTDENCNIPMCCRNGTGSAGHWGTPSVCDLPIRTLEAGLQQVSKLNPDFVIITGDFPPHDVWNQSRDYNIQYQQLVSSTVKNNLGGIPVYPMFGNHACFPINQYQFGLAGWIPAPFCKDWGLGADYQLSLELHAGYSVLHKLTKLRMIALDTQTGNAGNYYLAINATDPQGQLTWLYQQLLAAEANKEVVYIFAHIPFGGVDALTPWSRHVNVLMDRFEYTVAGLFFGHTHNDEFQINRGAFTNGPTKVQWIAPSFTTYTFHNPSFRLFQADEDTKIVTDYTQYVLNLNKANLDPSTPPTWDVAYSFKEFYGVKDLTPQSVYNLALNIGNNQTLALQYLANFYHGNNPPTGCDTKCMHELQCSLTYGIPDDVFNCLGKEKDWQFKLNEQFFPNWTYKYN